MTPQRPTRYENIRSSTHIIYSGSYFVKHGLMHLFVLFDKKMWTNGCPLQIAVGDYNVDAHMAQRILLPDGTVTNEGCLSGWGRYTHTDLGEFDIPWRVMLPPKQQASNLLVSAAVSASHVGCGPLRLEPQYMNLGHAAGVAASLLATHPSEYSTMHDIPVSTLQNILVQQGVQVHAKPRGASSYRCLLQVRNGNISVLRKCTPFKLQMFLSGCN